IDGGMLDISSITPTSMTVSGDFSGTGGTVTLGAKNLTVGNASSTSFAGVINGTGAFTKVGAGTLTLTGASGYTGGTTQSAGGLTLTGSRTVEASYGTLWIDGGSLDISSITPTGMTVGGDF